MNARLLLLLVLACTGGSALADDTAIQGVGGAIQPMDEHPSVIMRNMLVTIDLYADHAEVDCTFVFHNTGEAAAVRMGFPEHGHPVPKRGEPAGFTTFHTWVDGEPAQATIEGLVVEPDEPGPILWRRWRVKQVHFAREQTRTVRVLYRSALGLVSDGTRLFHHAVYTGASWKGPVASARLVLRLHHERPGWWFQLARPQFQRIGADAFEWSRRDFDPTSDDDVVIRYLHRYYGVLVGPTQIHPGDRPYPYIEDGVLWAQARDLADWLDAELTIRASDVQLTKGGRTVTLRQGSHFIEQNGHRSLIQFPPRIDRGHLMVPAAVVGRALGAEVTYEPWSHAARIMLPFQPPLVGAVGPLRASAAQLALPSGWSPPTLDEYDPHVVKILPVERVEHPTMCLGDFNGDGFPDLALLLRKRLEFGVVLLHGAPDETYRPEWLHRWSYTTPASPGRLNTILRVVLHGVLRYFKDGETEPMSGRLHLEHDGLELLFWGEAASVFYWDEETTSYRNVPTVD